MDALTQAYEAWNNMATFRRRRQRYKNFTYGRQWDDIVQDPDTGRRTTERELLSRYGRPPLTNNLIRQLIKSVIGRFRQSRNDNEYPDSSPEIKETKEQLRGIHRAHQLDEADSRLLEEFLISGVAVQRVGNASEERREELVANVNPNRFFIGAVSDPRCRDIEIIGMLHDYLPEEAVIRWGGRKRRGAMDMLEKMRNLTSGYSSGFQKDDEFYYGRKGHIRVIETWRKEAIEYFLVHDPEEGTLRLTEASRERELNAENRRRRQESRKPLNLSWRLEQRWTGRWFLPDGTLLESRVEEEHPFVVRLYPLIDGEIHSLVEDVIDQQKYVNRLVNLLDRMMASAAKGALLYPVDALPEGCDFNDILRQWSSTEGVVLYKSCPGDAAPKQLSTSVGDIGAKDLLKVEMELFKEISGVGDTLSPRTLGSGVGAERYAMELKNASLSIRDIIDTFVSMLDLRDLRLLKLKNSQLK